MEYTREEAEKSIKIYNDLCGLEFKLFDEDIELINKKLSKSKEPTQEEINKVLDHFETKGFAMYKTEEIEKQVEELESLKSKEEKTYSVGDRFELNSSEFMLCLGNNEKVGLINLSSGVRWHYYQAVKYFNNITQEEFSRICNGFENDFKQINK